MLSLSLSLPLPLCSDIYTESVGITIQPSDGEYREGNTAIFTCVAYGNPTNPSITWNRNGVPIDVNSTYSSVMVYEEVLEVGGIEFVLSNLEICGLSPYDAGLYTCTAQLPSGLSATSEEFWVNVTEIGRELKNN